MDILDNFCIQPSLNAILPAKPLRLSGFENMMPPVYTRVVYYFKKPPELSSKETFMPHTCLLESLKLTVDAIPIVCGCLRKAEDMSLEVSFERGSMPGAHFSVAQTTSNFPDAGSDVFQPDQVETELFSTSAYAQKTSPILFAARLTRYPCGSVALGISMHHSIADFSSLSYFVNTWGRIARGAEFEKMAWDRSSIANKENLKFFDDPPDLTLDTKLIATSNRNAPPPPPPNIKVRSFVVTKEALTKLKDAVLSKNKDKEMRISTHDAFVAHAWSAITRARNIGGDREVICGISVDTRAKFDPPLPANTFGSLVICKLTRLPAELVSNEEQMSLVAQSIRSSLIQINNEYLRQNLEWIDKQPDKSKVTININQRNEVVNSSWTKFAVYEADFGYGSPLRAMLPPWSIEGRLIILPSPPHWTEGEWNVLISLNPTALKRLEEDEEFSKYILK
ncbi:uncharacterized protein VTP21DRAFT_2899 [Calcarisporiella thermophila]|uniref:uncharacterized protein n=1 Tax=Calcarisporiella thermophila TaxID=911321 RepID=UPI003742A15D